jgi:hypothetical protein
MAGLGAEYPFFLDGETDRGGPGVSKNWYSARTKIQHTDPGEWQITQIRGQAACAKRANTGPIPSVNGLLRVWSLVRIVQELFCSGYEVMGDAAEEHSRLPTLDRLAPNNYSRRFRRRTRSSSVE